MTPPRNVTKTKVEVGSNPGLFHNISGIRHRNDQDFESAQTYKQAANDSQYSTNNTQVKDQIVGESQRDLQQDSFCFTRPVASDMHSPITGHRAERQDYSRSPMRSGLPSKSPARFPMTNRSGAAQLTDFPMLEQYDISLDDFRAERSANNEMTRIARHQLEIAQLIKNSLALIRRETPATANLLQQINAKVGAIRGEVQESKRRLQDIINVRV